jgi:hypothetical protein
MYLEEVCGCVWRERERKRERERERETSKTMEGKQAEFDEEICDYMYRLLSTQKKSMLNVFFTKA